MEDQFNKKYKDFLHQLNKVMLEFSVLLLMCDELHTEAQSEKMIDNSDDAIKKVAILKKTLIKATMSAQELVSVADIEKEI
jgi:hypothetical protein